MGGALHLEELDGRIGLLTLDVPGKKVNTLSRAVLGELAGLVAHLEGRSDLRGLLLRSGKPGQFIAGADLGEIAALAHASQEEAAGIIDCGHQLFGRLSRLPFPAIALIDGACLGGGSELALALDERLVSTSPETKIGQPEVQIGILPGWGGTQRLPRVVGLHHAIDMICSGDSLSAEKAVALGYAFDAVPAERLVEEGCRLIEHFQQTGEWQARGSGSSSR